MKTPSAGCFFLGGGKSSFVFLGGGVIFAQKGFVDMFGSLYCIFGGLGLKIRLFCFLFVCLMFVCLLICFLVSLLAGWLVLVF